MIGKITKKKDLWPVYDGDLYSEPISLRNQEMQNRSILIQSIIDLFAVPEMPTLETQNSGRFFFFFWGGGGLEHLLCRPLNCSHRLASYLLCCLVY